MTKDASYIASCHTSLNNAIIYTFTGLIPALVLSIKVTERTETRDCIHVYQAKKVCAYKQQVLNKSWQTPLTVSKNFRL